MNSKCSSKKDTFANPQVDATLLTAVVDYLGKNGHSYPHNVINDIATSEEISKEQVRKAVRKLKMQHKIIPAEPFKGKIELAQE